MKPRTCRAGLYALLLAAAALAAPAASAGKSEGQKPTKKPQTTCPVMGGKINKKMSADYQGKRIYLHFGGVDEEQMYIPLAGVR